MEKNKQVDAELGQAQIHSKLCSVWVTAKHILRYGDSKKATQKGYSKKATQKRLLKKGYIDKKATLKNKFISTNLILFLFQW